MPRLRLKFKTKEVTPAQLKKYKDAQTAEEKMNALDIPSGKRANITIKKEVLKRLWKTEHLVVRKNVSFSTNRRYIAALADHIAGETIMDAALKYGLEAHKLHRYKQRFLQADSMLPQFIEGLFEHAAVSALAIWEDKKHTLSAKDAALSAGIFASNAIAMKKARKTDYRDEQITLPTMLRLANVIDRIALLKQGEVIDIEAQTEIKNVTDKD